MLKYTALIALSVTVFGLLLTPRPQGRARRLTRLARIVVSALLFATASVVAYRIPNEHVDCSPGYDNYVWITLVISPLSGCAVLLLAWRSKKHRYWLAFVSAILALIFGVVDVFAAGLECIGS